MGAFYYSLSLSLSLLKGVLDHASLSIGMVMCTWMGGSVPLLSHREGCARSRISVNPHGYICTCVGGGCFPLLSPRNSMLARSCVSVKNPGMAHTYLHFLSQHFAGNPRHVQLFFFFFFLITNVQVNTKKSYAWFFKQIFFCKQAWQGRAGQGREDHFRHVHCVGSYFSCCRCIGLLIYAMSPPTYYSTVLVQYNKTRRS